MSYYWFNKEEVLQKPKEKYNNCGGKEKSAEYYRANKKKKKQKIGTEICQKKKRKQKRVFKKQVERNEKECKFIHTVLK